MSDKRQIKNNKGEEQRTSRRDFLGQVAVGAAAAAIVKPRAAASATADLPLQVPRAVAESLSGPSQRAEFTGEGMTGAQVFANLCKDENLAALLHVVDRETGRFTGSVGD